MVDGFVILFFYNQFFFCASKKILLEGDVLVILERKRKAPERDPLQV